MTILFNNSKTFCSLLLVVSLVLFSTVIKADNLTYNIRADGLACPYCAYGIEKKFKKLVGFKSIDIDLNKGLVIVTGNEKMELTETMLTKLFNDSGFTFRNMQKVTKKEFVTKQQIK